MTIDFKLENDEIKSLSVVKKQNTANHYQCIDEDNFCWMEVEISIPNIELVKPKEDIIKDFHKLSNPIFEKVLQNNTQIQTLTKTRDELLPKLMSGEIRVKKQFFENFEYLK